MLLPVVLLAGFGAGYVAFSIVPTLPSVGELEQKQEDIDIPLRVYTIDGRLIAEYGDQRRRPISIDDLPQAATPEVVSAVLIFLVNGAMCLTR